MNKVCLITGASGGIGAAIAKKMAACGFSLYLHYNEQREEVSKLAQHIKDNYDVQVTIIQANLQSKAGVDHLLNEISEDVDIFIHTGGNSYYGLLTDMTYEQIEKMIFLHLTSAILISQHILPAMIRKGYGKIIMMSSIWGLTGASCEVVYSAVKGGLNSYVKALAKEVGPANICVNGIAPGAIQTKMMKSFSEEEIASICDEVPLSRLGDPEEVANVAKFLVSEEASYITGQIISVNGGWHC